MSSDSGEFFPISHFISLVLWSSCFLFVMMCSFHVSLRSKCRPRYLAIVPRGMTVWLILTAGHCPLRRVNIMCVDLFSLTSFSISWASSQCYAGSLGDWGRPYCKHRISLFVFWSSTGKQGVTGQHAATVAEYTYFSNKHNNKVRATRSPISPGVIHSVTTSNAWVSKDTMGNPYA